MILKPIIRLFLIFVLLSIGRTFAEGNAITILTHPGINWANEEGHGFVYEFIDVLKKHENINLVVMPLSRNKVAFGNQEFDCYFGGSPKIIKEFLQVDTLNSLPITRDYMRAFTLSGDSTVKKLEDLKGENIAIDYGHEQVLPEDIRSEINITHPEDSESALKMLKAKHVKAILIYQGGLNPEILKQLDFHQPLFVFSTSDFINCKSNERTEINILRINDALKSASKQNELADVYKKFSRIMPSIYTTD